MIPLLVTITAYDHGRNVCQAKLQDGRIIELDPFVSCAIKLTDEEYAANKGAEIVGKAFVMALYSVYIDHVVPHEGGFVEF